MFEIVERSFIEQDKIISKHNTIDEAIENFNYIMEKYDLALSVDDVEEFEEYNGYRLLEHIHHKHGLIKLGIREVQ